jgi:hypothetical protein
VLVYDVDTEGRVHMLFPYRRLDPHWVTGGREYVLPGPHSSYALTIEGPPGVEYIQALASLEPFQQLPEWMDPDAEPADYNLDNSDWRSGGTVVGDPFLGLERVNRSILPYDCDEEDCYSAAYTSYYVERKVSYPRYLCADCHGPYAGVYYDPYGTRCSVFEIRVDYDWRWRRHWPFYGNPYWYYFRRNDCPPRYFSFKPRWSSNDGWIRFRDSFGEKVLWKRDAGPDPKAGDDPRWREHRGGGGGGGSIGGGGSGGGGGGGRGSAGGATPPSGSFGGSSRDRVRTQPVRVPVQPTPPAEEPVRFRSRSREVAPPSQPRVDVGQSRTPPSSGGSQDRARDPGRDQPRREQPAREQPRREEPAREQPAREQPRRQEPAREQPKREEPAREQPRQEPAREQYRQAAPPRPEPDRQAPARSEPARERPGRG